MPHRAAEAKHQDVLATSKHCPPLIARNRVGFSCKREGLGKDLYRKSGAVLIRPVGSERHRVAIEATLRVDLAGVLESEFSKTSLHAAREARQLLVVRGIDADTLDMESIRARRHDFYLSRLGDGKLFVFHRHVTLFSIIAKKTRYASRGEN